MRISSNGNLAALALALVIGLTGAGFPSIRGRSSMRR